MQQNFLRNLLHSFCSTTVQRIVLPTTSLARTVVCAQYNALDENGHCCCRTQQSVAIMTGRWNHPLIPIGLQFSFWRRNCHPYMQVNGSATHSERWRKMNSLHWIADIVHIVRECRHFMRTVWLDLHLDSVFAIFSIYNTNTSRIMYRQRRQIRINARGRQWHTKQPAMVSECLRRVESSSVSQQSPRQGTSKHVADTTGAVINIFKCMSQ